MNYNVWALNKDYTVAALVDRYIALEYSQTLNGIGYCRVDLSPRDAKIPSLKLMNRLRVVRGGEIVWQGIIVRREWSKSADMRADTFSVFALDYTWYTQVRVTLPPTGSEYQTFTDHADDIARAIVRTNAGAGASSARRFADLTVESDAHACTSLSFNTRYQRLDAALNKLAAGRFDWRFVPTESGCEFRVKSPIWGVDRTKGNGVNDEFVMSADRGNFQEMRYEEDASQAVSAVWVGGQGEGVARTIVERTDSERVATLGRLEAFYDQRQLELQSSLEAAGDAYLAENGVAVLMSGKPAHGTWKAGWDLGDIVSFYARDFAETFSCNAKIVALKVRLDNEGENVVPQFEVVA